MTALTTLDCPVCGVGSDIEVPVVVEELDPEEEFGIIAHVEEELGMNFEALAAFVKEHPRTPMSIMQLSTALRLNGQADIEPIKLRWILLHAHRVGAVYLYKTWFTTPNIYTPMLTYNRDYVVFSKPPETLLRQNCEKL